MPDNPERDYDSRSGQQVVSTNKALPKLLSVTQLAQIHVSDPPIGKALKTIVDYINKNVPPPQGTKIKPRLPTNHK